MLYIVKVSKAGGRITSPVYLNYETFIKSPNSNIYYMGISHVSTNLSKGKYLILVSFQNEIEGNLKLLVRSSDNKEMSEMPNIINNTGLDPLNKFSLKFFKEKPKKSQKKNDVKKFKPFPFSQLYVINQAQFTGSWTWENTVGVDRNILPSYQNFFENPGLFIKPQENGSFVFHLESLKYRNECEKRRLLEQGGIDLDYEGVEPPSLSICIVKINKKEDFENDNFLIFGDFVKNKKKLKNFEKIKNEIFGDFEILEEDDNYAPCSWGHWTKPVELSSDAYGYFVLCINYNMTEKKRILQNDQRLQSFEKIENFSQKFNIQVFSQKKNFEIKQKEFFSFYKTYAMIRDDWDCETSGGPIFQNKFFLNPNFLIKNETKKENLIFLKLSSETEIPLSLAICENKEEKSLIEMQQEELEKIKGGEIFLYNLNTAHFCLDCENQVSIVPTLMHPDYVKIFFLFF